MKPFRPFLLLILPLVLSSAARADELVLRNGSVFSGIVQEQGDQVVIHMDYGTMSFKKVDVRTITRGNDPLKEFEQKSRVAVDAKSMAELAAWCKDKGLGGRAQELYRKIILLNPDHAEARKSLGFEKFNGQWLEGDELMQARGWVRFQGKWMDRDVAMRLQEQQAAALQENERLSLEKRIADQSHAVELARINLERERIDLEKWKDGYGYRSYSWGYYPPGYGYGVGIPYLPNLPPPRVLPPVPQVTIPLSSPLEVPRSRR